MSQFRGRQSPQYSLRNWVFLFVASQLKTPLEPPFNIHIYGIYLKCWITFMNIYVTYIVAADFLNAPFLCGVSCVVNLFCLLFSILLWRNEADGPQLYSARVL
jgi:hypothetical protein